MIRIAGLVLGLVLGLALVGLPTSASVAADRDVVAGDAAVGTRVVVKRRHYHRRAYGCPDGYGCYPLYGAYGPYGGRAYWSSFSYLVPTDADRGYAYGTVLRSRY
jgi:hypothetical protein